MAEQIDPQSDVVTESEDTATDTSPPGALQRMAKVMLPIVLVPLLLGGGVVYMQYESFVSAAMVMGINFGTKDAEAEEEPITYGEFMQIDGMIINPADSQGKRYLLVSIGLESHEVAVLEEVEQKDVVVRDVILNVLGTRTVDELTNIAHRSTLKEEVRNAVNEVLREGEIDRMYFTQYVIQ